MSQVLNNGIFILKSNNGIIPVNCQSEDNYIRFYDQIIVSIVLLNKVRILVVGVTIN